MPTRQDAIALLESDHKTVEALFRRFEKLTGRAGKSKEKIVRQLIRELAVHAAIEEMLFYPAVRAAAKLAKPRTLQEAGDTVLESLEEHHIVKWTLSELEKMSASDERFDAKVRVLTESVRHHVKEEQDELFPKVRRLLGKEDLADLGDRLQKAKRLAPTRPHPRAPDQPPGNVLASIPAAMMDKGAELVKGFLDRKRPPREAPHLDA